MDRLPIIYVRGYAGSTSGIDEAVNDPFYGFNLGATHVRVGGDGDPMFHQFEGPLLRLMIDEDYELLVEGDQSRYLREAKPGELEERSLWIYRFYDQAATTFVKPPDKNVAARVYRKVHRKATADGFDIETATEGLYDLIMLILEKTGAPKVHLVAHSMGGLVVRCIMQKICFLPIGEGGGRRRGPVRRQMRRLREKLRMKRRPIPPVQGAPRVAARKLVARFFTYGTPHGGIALRPWGVDWFQRTFGPSGSDVFDPGRMYGYLTPHATYGDTPPSSVKWDPQVIPEKVFAAADIFCLVGTNSKDYEAARGASRHAVGPMSDGLVLIENAYVRGAHRAYVHRSHSGRYGLVNSEEGYQNLRRFLFGRWQIGMELVGLPAAPGDSGWQADTRLAIRGLPIVMSEQRADHWCPVLLSEEIKRHRGASRCSVPLVSTFLLNPGRAAIKQPPSKARAGSPHQRRMRYTLTLQVSKLSERNGTFIPDDHLEQVPDWGDWLIIDMESPRDGTIPKSWAAWKSTVEGENDRFDPIAKQTMHFLPKPHHHVSEITLPPGARGLPVLGPDAKLRITVHKRSSVRADAARDPWTAKHRADVPSVMRRLADWVRGRFRRARRTEHVETRS
ncbi:esterase/lipase family protein [Streptomyces sp. NPDC058279]|uniref:esterase/lipase family protein n=1 Tax=Streptomyces sp. NPDC058279 TaxID=3346418 RepID=UPI0036E5C16C